MKMKIKMKLNEIYNDDCLNVLPSFSEETFDMILCDLPYGTSANRWDVIIPLDKLWEQYKRIIKPNGVIVLTAIQPFASQLIISNPSMFKYEWIWVKKNPKGFINAKKMPLKNIENILVFYKHTPTYNPQGLIRVDKKRTNDKSKNGTNDTGISSHNGGKMKGEYIQEFTNYPTQILNFSSEQGLHSTQKPVPLFEYLIRTYTNVNDLVLDNCIGSGTTAIACINSERNYIGIEKYKEIFDIAQKRVEKHKL
jgi:site-specific DNA-methyltransferase (adenine-specific)